MAGLVGLSLTSGCATQRFDYRPLTNQDEINPLTGEPVDPLIQTRTLGAARQSAIQVRYWTIASRLHHSGAAMILRIFFDNRTTGAWFFERARQRIEVDTGTREIFTPLASGKSAVENIRPGPTQFMDLAFGLPAAVSGPKDLNSFTYLGEVQLGGNGATGGEVQRFSTRMVRVSEGRDDFKGDWTWESMKEATLQGKLPAGTPNNEGGPFLHPQDTLSPNAGTPSL